jgi:hypothetical protein
MEVGSTETNTADSRALLELWENARLEYDAADHLLLAGGRDLDLAVTLHLLRGWHALATIHARQSGRPEPVFETFEIDRESELLAPMPAKKRASWEDSFAAIREAALAEPLKVERPETDRKSLKLQLRFLGRCIAARRGDVMASSWSWRRLFRMRLPLTAAAAVVLILVAVGLVNRLDEDDDQTLYPGFAEIAEPVTVTVDSDQLRELKPRGYPWDGSGNVVFRDRLIVTLGGPKHPEVISVGLDGNDRYSLRLMMEDVQVGTIEVGPSASHGLEVYSAVVPVEASLAGINSIVIEVLDGDGSHSIGHLIFEMPGDRQTR